MPMPFIAVAIALKKAIAVELAGTGTKARHHRHRESSEDEYPCLAVRIISNDPSTQGEQENAYGLPEAVWELTVDLVIDTELPVEVEAPDDDEGDDPTGYATAGAILARVLDMLFPVGPDGEPTGDTNNLGGTTWQIRYDGTSPDETDASPDRARMEERLVLLYRVRADRPTELLLGS